MDAKGIVGKNIRKFRLIRGDSQEYLAGLCDTSAAHLGQIERGEKGATVDTIFKIARGLQVKPADLLETDIDYEINLDTDVEIAKVVTMMRATDLATRQLIVDVIAKMTQNDFMRS